MRNPFTEHPRSVGETYWEHFRFAFAFGWLMTLGAAAALVHSVFPFLFTTTAGRVNDELQAMRQRSPGRLRQDRAAAEAARSLRSE